MTNKLVYRRRTKNGASKKVSIRLSPVTARALQVLHDRFAQTYPPSHYPSLTLLFERALIRLAEDVKYDSRQLESEFEEMKKLGYSSQLDP
jgi:hypothetical protein